MDDMKSEIAALVDRVRRESWAEAEATASAHNAKAEQRLAAANAALAAIGRKYGKPARGKFKSDFLGGNNPKWRLTSPNYFG